MEKIRRQKFLTKSDEIEQLLEKKFATTETDRSKISSALMVKTDVLMGKLYIPKKDYKGSGMVDFTILDVPVKQIPYEKGFIKMKNIFETYNTDIVYRMIKDGSQLKYNLHQLLMLAQPNLEQLLLYTDKLNDSGLPKGSSIDTHGGVVALNLLKISQKIFLMQCVKYRGVIDGKIQTPFG